MFYFKLILILCSLWCFYQATIEDNLDKAYDYFMYLCFMMWLVFLTEPVI